MSGFAAIAFLGACLLLVTKGIPAAVRFMEDEEERVTGKKYVVRDEPRVKIRRHL